MSEQKLQDTLIGFKQLVKKMKAYEEALAVMYWDLRTGAPRKGVEARSEVIGELSTEMFKLAVSEEMGDYINVLSGAENFDRLDLISQRMVTECKKDYDRSKKIPPEKYQAYVTLTSSAESVWEEAKAAADFTMFQPYLERIVKFKQEFIELWGYEGNKYNTLLDMYEPGMTVEKLDQVFGELRKKTVPLVAAIKDAANKPETAFLYQFYDKQKQREFSLWILQEMGFDFAAGRLDESVHPFATGLNPGDVRITTNFKLQDIGFALFGTIHEGGHALYEQNISKDLLGTNLCTGTSMGIHESQSRYWENFVGCSRPFWHRYFKDLQRMFPENLRDVTVEQFYRGINEATPSLIRIEADELTYNLHIMIRYEIEKGLINGDINVADLPEVWNAKYEEYLGVRPSHNGEGVLQDVHWSGGDFGYFPSYALGNMYAAQFEHTIKKQIDGYEELISSGNLQPIKEWLHQKIHQYGKSQTPAEIIRRMTGEDLNPAYLIEHLTAKYKDIYSLK